MEMEIQFVTILRKINAQMHQTYPDNCQQLLNAFYPINRAKHLVSS